MLSVEYQARSILLRNTISIEFEWSVSVYYWFDIATRYSTHTAIPNCYVGCIPRSCQKDLNNPATNEIHFIACGVLTNYNLVLEGNHRFKKDAHFLGEMFIDH